jgi:hypothetical protein
MASSEVNTIKIVSVIKKILNILTLEQKNFMNSMSHFNFSQQQKWSHESADETLREKYIYFQLLCAEAKLCSFLDQEYLRMEYTEPPHKSTLDVLEKKILENDILEYKRLLRSNMGSRLLPQSIRTGLFQKNCKTEQERAQYLFKMLYRFTNELPLDLTECIYLRQSLFSALVLFFMLDLYIELCIKVEFQYLYVKFIVQCNNLEETHFNKNKARRFLYLAEIVELQTVFAFSEDNILPGLVKKLEKFICELGHSNIIEEFLQLEDLYYVDWLLPKPINVYTENLKQRDTLLEPSMVNFLVENNIDFELAITNDELKAIIDVFKDKIETHLLYNTIILNLLDKIYNNPFECKISRATEYIQNELKKESSKNLVNDKISQKNFGWISELKREFSNYLFGWISEFEFEREDDVLYICIFIYIYIHKIGVYSCLYLVF